MSRTRHTIFFAFVSSLFLASFVSGGLAYAFYAANLFSVELAFVLFFALNVLFSSVLFHTEVSRPMHIIIREMKALLTGKSYRKIFTRKKNEIGILAHFFNEVTRNLESISGDFKKHDRIEKELNTAQRIQRDLLPSEMPNFPGLEIYARTQPASEIGGDTFDFFEVNGRYLMYVGDSTGHGIPAGIVMIMVDTLIETFIHLYESLWDIMVSLNKYLKPHLQTTMFMTMLLFQWFPVEKKFKWIGAGHEYLIHVQTQANKVSAIPSGGIAVGMVPDNSALVKEAELPLEKNDFVILYSDGINEAKNVNGDIYTLEKLVEFSKSHAKAEISAKQLFDYIADDVRRFMQGHPQEDDMTLIVVKHLGNEEEASALSSPAS